MMITSAAFALVNDASAQAPLLYAGEMGPDTINSGETLYHYPGGTSFATARRFRDLGALEVLIQSDSLSGATNGTAVLQVSYDLAGTQWYDVTSLTLNGAATQYSKTEDADFTPTWFRIKYTGTGVQATKVQSSYAFKRRL